MIRPPMLIAFAAVSVAVAVAACGSSAKPSSSGRSSGYPQRLEFVVCMRSHGVPNLPDPSASGTAPSGSYNSFEGIVIPTTINMQSPAFLSAEHTCASLLLGAGGPKPAIPESVKLQALANAQCMRKHGVPNFPDPVFPSSGGIAVQVGGPGDGPQSPAFQAAEKVCGRAH